MELLKELKSELQSECLNQNWLLYPSYYRSYILSSINFSKTRAGYLFWAILHYSYYYHGTYDYITIVKLYHKYGRSVFKINVRIYLVYINNTQSNVLSEYSFDWLCELIDSELDNLSEK